MSQHDSLLSASKQESHKTETPVSNLSLVDKSSLLFKNALSRNGKIFMMNFLIGIIAEFFLSFIEIHSKQKSRELIANAEDIMEIFPLYSFFSLDFFLSEFLLF